MDASIGDIGERRGRWGPRGTAGATFAGHLTFENATRRFGGVTAVSDVSLELLPGEIACLLGPSGCGKTTLLRLAAGIDEPTSGRVLLDGEEVAGPHRFVPPEKRNVGLMFQDFALFPHLTILGNVAFGLRKLPRADAAKSAMLALQRVGLADYAGAYPHHLSGGEQQRVALARALVPRPQVMLMDEPFSGLDQRLRDSVRSETLALLRETRASSLMVTHDPIEAMGIADRIFLMRQGRLVQQGAPEDLYRRPIDAAAARFFSDANEFLAPVRDGMAVTPVGQFRVPAGIGGHSVLVMIRVQGIRPSPVGPMAMVVDSRFEGDNVRCTLIFEGHDEPVLALIPSDVAPGRGEALGFVADHGHILMFELQSGNLI